VSKAGQPWRYDPERTLLASPLVWLCVAVPLVAAVGLAGAIAVNDAPALDWTSEGYAAFVRAFQVPLGVLALISLLVTLIASHHNSAQ